MAEQEVIKHTKIVYKIWNSKEHSLFHKLREFFIEILIIVFAVTLSIWLHDRSEYSHQQGEVKEFLMGLKEDLVSDTKEMQEDKVSFINQSTVFRYIGSLNARNPLKIDSLKAYRGWMFNTTSLQQNNGRFEGFRSSGKIGYIEDKGLQNDIMDLYQENIPSLLASTDGYNRRKERFFDFVIRNHKELTDSTTNIAAILLYDEAQNIAASLSDTREIIQRYDSCIQKMQQILAEIEAKYKE